MESRKLNVISEWLNLIWKCLLSPSLDVNISQLVRYKVRVLIPTPSQKRTLCTPPNPIIGAHLKPSTCLCCKARMNVGVKQDGLEIARLVLGKREMKLGKCWGCVTRVYIKIPLAEVEKGSIFLLIGQSVGFSVGVILGETWLVLGWCQDGFGSHL